MSQSAKSGRVTTVHKRGRLMPPPFVLPKFGCQRHLLLVIVVALIVVVSLIVIVALIEEFRKNTCAFLPDSGQRLWVEPERTQDCRSDLGSLNKVVDLAPLEECSRDKQGHVSVVQRSATVLSNLLLASRVDHSVIGLNDYVRRSGRSH